MRIWNGRGRSHSAKILMQAHTVTTAELVAHSVVGMASDQQARTPSLLVHPPDSIF